jgi:hypothetical protein
VAVASPAPPPTKASPADPTIARLVTIKSLLKKGFITEAEYTKKRAEILQAL